MHGRHSATNVNSESLVTAHRTKKHFYTLDAMRGIAAIAVVIHHFTQFTQYPLFKNGVLAVDIFFILSGFVLTYSYKATLDSGMPPSDYILRRLIRLYPMFLLGLILGTITFYYYSKGHSTYTTGDTILSVICNAFFIPYINDGQIFHENNGVTHAPVFPTNDPLWSLCFEMIASVAFIVVAKLKLQTLLKIVCFSFLTLLVLGVVANSLIEHKLGLYVAMGWGSENIWGGFPRVIYGFTFGIILYMGLNVLKTTKLTLYFSTFRYQQTLLCGCVVLVCAFPYWIKGLYYFLVIGLVAPLIVYLGAITTHPNETHRKIAQFLGWISYPIYCLHYPIGRAVILVNEKYNIDNNHETLSVAIAFIITLIVSMICTKVYDEPVRAYVSQKLRNTDVLGVFFGPLKRYARRLTSSHDR